MKKYLYLFILSLLVMISCRKKEVHISTLQNRERVFYELNQLIPIPFTGKSFNKYPNGQLISEVNY